MRKSIVWAIIGLMIAVGLVACGKRRWWRWSSEQKFI